MSTLKVGAIQSTTGNTAMTVANTGIITAPTPIRAPGSVLQVLQSHVATEVATTSTSFVTSGLFVNITPIATSSKVLVRANIGGFFIGQNDDIYATIYRGSTNLGVGNASCLFNVHNDNAQNRYGAGSMEFLDSPNTTSQTTYTVYFRSSNSNNILLNRSDNGIFLTAMEIGG